MTQIVPAILENDFAEIKKKIKIIKPFTDFIQLDVMDGIFVPNKTFADAKLVAQLPISLEVHLMIVNPSLFVKQWALPNVKRLIVHYEAMTNVDFEIETIRKTKKEVAIAINPDTSTFSLKPYLDKIDMVLIMGVEPGFSGQDFQKDVLEKIREIKKLKPGLLVEIDGGVSMHNHEVIVDAGADILVAHSAIWKAKDLAKVFQELRGENR
ncbi:MAG: hypothetical protein A2233_05095 [Candidatus Kerfeldbacteria bacterium RIFOXYA2_FULL_38_24]|uniref:Ribulose-phosphate 3-epimerase n=1 Tax=Candidatus Kerfeldbacteria bacterium RIFOXYB2_FULL_38_14 TaxID=1798547 RepID=A0A1G2BH54_9BACT|nr:MAG: hypothetical protein A2233_05095 [Candidatus Kerfeldbacteria bacterium RIFOXYA2_FULL_38_24]OGY88395.1 MAG: hypothetical protein A2319_05155 [Candidatus Kerfeldbacteria bacterium RIFOXYB2_FULL_38_14]OGY89084.1 MAG: hypothetical protein A2458_00745 [Candidatus Kerfeldbacteria bacterium RIFOXYC2_FULL_38_9]